MRAIVQICRLVGGAPLPILLAASYTNDFSCREILDSIRENVNFLSSNAVDLPDRHRGIRALLDHTWTWLSSYEQTILALAAIFRGNFSREAAMVVTGAEVADLGMLTRKSLLAQPKPGIYRMHELLRQFAVRQLKDVEKYECGCRHHAEYYLHLLNEHQDNLTKRNFAQVLPQLREELDNIRQAWEWTVNQVAADLDYAVNLENCSWTLMHFYDLNGLHREGALGWKQMLIPFPPTEIDTGQRVDRRIHRIYAQLLAQWAHFLTRLGRYQQAVDTALTVIELAQMASDDQSEVVGLRVCGVGMASLGKYEVAQEKFTCGLELASQFQLHHEEIYILIELGAIERNYGRYTSAKAYLQRALRIAREVGDPMESSALGHLGIIALHQSEFDVARDYFSQELQNTQHISPHLTLRSLGALAWIDLKQGNFERASEYNTASLELARKKGHPPDTSRALRGLAWLSFQRGDFREASAYFAESWQIINQAGHLRGAAITLNNWGLMNDLQGEHGLARKRFNESLDISRRINARQMIAETSVNLAFNLLATNETESAKSYLHEALVLAHETGTKAVLNEAIAGYARLYLALGDIKQSAELLYAIWNHQNTSFEIIDSRLQSLKHELAVILGEDEVEVCLSNRNGMSLEPIVDRLMSQFQ